MSNHFRSIGINSSGSSRLRAIGGTVTDVGGYRIHKFTSSADFKITQGRGSLEVLVVAGGGGSTRSTYGWGGGGGGGILHHTSLEVSHGTIPVTVGLGSTRTGEDSFFGELRAFGGGCCESLQDVTLRYGGSGGGAGHMNPAGGTSLSIQTSNNGGIGYGNIGGASRYSAPYPQGSGGGAGAAGSIGGNGGVGKAFSISGTSTYYSGGGGQCTNSGGITSGGAGGGGRNGPGAANTGGGAGGGQGLHLNYSGGSGIVFVRYLIE